ncbi:MAG: amidohydrolase family protein [Ilumatobacteraceae bacterium]|nr:amidohydrolase family protein [Ilumatobacteraceae bacterium]
MTTIDNPSTHTGNPYIDPYLNVPVNDPYIIVSADSHAGLPTADYREYLEKKFHPQFDEFLAERDKALEVSTMLGTRNEDYAKKWFEEHEEALRSGWEATRRDQELDGDGVAGEIIFPDADAVESRTCVPFGAGLGMSGDMDPELGLAGSIAHNRWLAELCSQSPERRRGMALVPITADLPRVLAEIRRAKDSGLGGVMIPAMWVNQLPYHDRHYDPVWALCEELNMPISTHSGPASRDEYDNHLGIYVTEVVWWPARPLWFMLWSGVFERFPGLRFGVTEAGCWWLPPQIWFWDRLALGQKGTEKLGGDPFKGAIKMLPSEYIDRNVFIGASNTKRRELGMRYEIGVGNIMWGNDFPHPEGTWPNTRAWLKKTFHDIPIDETRRMVGLSAAELFSFDLAKLKVHADRMAPCPSDFGQVTDDDPTAQRLTDRWAPVKEVGRHWLTDHDFSLIP